MLSGLAGRNKILLLAVWSFFSFALVRAFSIFVYTISYTFFWYAGLYSLLFFSYYFVFRSRFGSKLNYAHYTANNISFVALIILFSYLYHKVIMLDNDHFAFNFFIAIVISNLLAGSILFLFTLIKRR